VTSRLVAPHKHKACQREKSCRRKQTFLDSLVAALILRELRSVDDGYRAVRDEGEASGPYKAIQEYGVGSRESDAMRDGAVGPPTPHKKTVKNAAAGRELGLALPDDLACDHGFRPMTGAHGLGYRHNCELIALEREFSALFGPCR